MILAKKIFEFHASFQKCHFGKSIMKMAIRRNIHNSSQGLPNPGFMQKKVQKGDFLKKAIARIDFFFLFKVPMNL